MKKQEQGFSLIEALIAMLIGGIVLAAASTMVIKAIQVSDAVTVRVEMQQDARAAMNSVMKDLSLAGTGMPVGGIQLPTGKNSSASLFGCSAAGTCYLTNHLLPLNHLYSVLPDPGDAKVLTGTGDALTVVYVDRSLNLGLANSITPSGSQLKLNSVTNINIGDLVMLTNAHGSALGMVTNVLPASNTVVFANSDPLNINQPSADNGNIAALKDPPPGNNYPPTTASKILIISYYLQQTAGPDGVAGTDDDVWQLMRQVNALPPSPVIDGVQAFQLSYDLYDDTAGSPETTLRTNTKNANNTPGLIHKINVFLNVRSPRRTGAARAFSFLTLASSVSPRNLSFRDRYK
jgi:prepilin-type N-terminal cleavage/methylation domain-containing protein